MRDQDAIEEFCGTKIQHGPYNDRIYLMKMANGSCAAGLPGKLISKAKTNGYAKIFAKIPVTKANEFLQAGYTQEARIPNFYKGLTDALFLGYYLSDKRSVETEYKLFDDIIDLAIDKANASPKPSGKALFTLRPCTKEDVVPMSEIYRTVFPSYPFPIHDPHYLLETMQNNVLYFGVEFNGALVALSSAEMDMEALNVEMTDFATLPKWRGNSFSAHLLARMEEVVIKIGIMTAYTIARAVSPGVNITFARRGYSFGGRLKNNTNISGKIESMNVWYRQFLNI